MRGLPAGGAGGSGLGDGLAGLGEELLVFGFGWRTARLAIPGTGLDEHSGLGRDQRDVRGLLVQPAVCVSLRSSPNALRRHAADRDFRNSFAISQNQSIANTNFTSVNPTTATATSTVSATIDPTATGAGQNAEGANHQKGHHAQFVSIIAGTGEFAATVSVSSRCRGLTLSPPAVVTTLACVGVFSLLTWWILRKRRAARQGVRLSSTSDLNSSEEGFRQGGGTYAATRDMSEKGHAGRSHVSLFLPSESFMTSRRESTTSFGTNSVSSRSYSGSEFTETASLMSMDEDDIDADSISPFHNSHRAPSQRSSASFSLTAPSQARFASRNNLHNQQRESGSTWMTTATGRVVPGTGASRRGHSHLAPDARSLLSMAPSSTGATWGRETEEDPEEEEEEHGHRHEHDDESGSSDGDDDYERRFQATDSTFSLTSGH